MHKHYTTHTHIHTGTQEHRHAIAVALAHVYTYTYSLARARANARAHTHTWVLIRQSPKQEHAILFFGLDEDKTLYIMMGNCIKIRNDAWYAL